LFYNQFRNATVTFRWIEWNIEKVTGHGVWPEEAEEVVMGASRPYPSRALDGRWLVWGPTSRGQLLQVVYLLDPDGTVFVIHARPLTDREKRRLRRRLS
jgi:uncharacterized DUF497 family protein